MRGQLGWRREFNDLQGYWSRIAQERGILTASDLERYLKR